MAFSFSSLMILTFFLLLYFVLLLLAMVVLVAVAFYCWIYSFTSLFLCSPSLVDIVYLDVVVVFRLFIYCCFVRFLCCVFCFFALAIFNFIPLYPHVVIRSVCSMFIVRSEIVCTRFCEEWYTKILSRVKSLSCLWKVLFII